MAGMYDPKVTLNMKTVKQKAAQSTDFLSMIFNKITAFTKYIAE